MSEQLEIQRAQLEQLRLYRADYAERFTKQQKVAHLSASDFEDYRYFFSSIDKAIRQQELVVEELERPTPSGQSGGEK